jgi:hypothetical protein
MIIDFYAADGTWLDSCDAAQFDVQRLAAILAAKFGPVRTAKREDVRYVKGATLDFSDWLMTV